MAKDMKKMMRQYAKLQAKSAQADPDLPKLLEMVAVLVSQIHVFYTHFLLYLKIFFYMQCEMLKAPYCLVS
jgi:hypothetical protein